MNYTASPSFLFLKANKIGVLFFDMVSTLICMRACMHAHTHTDNYMYFKTTATKNSDFTAPNLMSPGSVTPKLQKESKMTIKLKRDVNARKQN